MNPTDSPPSSASLSSTSLPLSPSLPDFSNKMATASASIPASLNFTAQFVRTHYSKLTYMDLYSGTVMLFAVITVAVMGVFSYMQVMMKRAEIEKDWNNQRCNPAYIPFAGWITHPDDKTALEYTNENFQYCLQNELKGVSATATAPLQYMLGGLTDVGQQMSDSMNSMRNFLASMRGNIQNFAEDVFSRTLNIVMPLQKTMIAFKDTLQKTQGVMTSALFTMLGSYYALQSLMGAILELVIKLLIALLAIIIGLWAVPFTWPAAASMSAVFLGISIPLSIIAVFMTEVLHVKSSPIPKLRCFDGDTMLPMEDGTLRKIREVRAGDKLIHGNVVTATVVVSSAHLDMVRIKDVLVSGNHKVSYFNRWISARTHPLAVRLTKEQYAQPVVYCLNTSTKTIECGGMVWLDWDELHGEMLKQVLKKCSVYLETPLGNLPTTRSIHAYLDGGYAPDTRVKLKSGKWVEMQNIRIGDEVWQGGSVYGKVVVETSRMVRNHGKLAQWKEGTLAGKGSGKELGGNPSTHTHEPVSVSTGSSSSSSPPLHHLLTTDCQFTVQRWNEHDRCNERETVTDYNHLIDQHLF